MVMRGRGGQFYLVAAIVIITILIGFSVVSNYSRNKEVVKLYDLKQELNIETAKVLEYGTYRTENADELLSDFAENYAAYTGEGKNMYFFFGNFEKITAVGYQDISTDKLNIELRGGGGIKGKEISCKIKLLDRNGEIISEETTTSCAGSLGGETEMVQGETITFEGFSTQKGTIEEQVHLLIDILGSEYHFRLRTGENFYFVLEQIVGGERYVVSG